MLEELDDDVNTLIDRLREVDRNLDHEIDKINEMISECGPRSSTKFQEIASQLRDNLRARVSETISGRSESNVLGSEVSPPETEDMFSAAGIDRNSFDDNRRQNRSSRTTKVSNKDMASQFVDEIKVMSAS